MRDCYLQPRNVRILLNVKEGGTRDSVVEAPCYEPEGRGFDS
jgi:hypothetical protein